MACEMGPSMSDFGAEQELAAGPEWPLSYECQLEIPGCTPNGQDHGERTSMFDRRVEKRLVLPRRVRSHTQGVRPRAGIDGNPYGLLAGEDIRRVLGTNGCLRLRTSLPEAKCFKLSTKYNKLGYRLRVDDLRPRSRSPRLRSQEVMPVVEAEMSSNKEGDE